METHIEFTIYWNEILKFIGYGVFWTLIIIGIILYIFRNFRLY